MIGIWLASCLCLWIATDLDIHRAPYMDEGLFWVVAGVGMVKNGIIAAQTSVYPGGGMHPFGIPFMLLLQ